MTIYFSPEYKGHLYVDLDKKNGNLEYNCCYKNFHGFIDLLASLLGVQVRNMTYGQRLAIYYEALSKCVAKNPSCVYASSFATDSLGTAKQCLEWRDELSMFGWTKDTPAPTPRLQWLSTIEDYFNCDGFDRLKACVIASLKDNCDVLNGSEIIVPFKKKILAPYITEILDLLENGGCIIKYYTDKDEYERLLTVNDGVKVWEFDTEREANLYLATLPAENFDVWIYHDTQLLDKYLHSANRPTVGSSISSQLPQSCQLLTFALRLMSKPVDTVTLVRWLQLPKHPVKKHFQLANSIISSGGYHNIASKEYVDIEDNSKWLPDLKIAETETMCTKVNVVLAEKYVTKLCKWAQIQTGMATRVEDFDFPQSYFDCLIDLCEAFSALLKTHIPEAYGGTAPNSCSIEVECDILIGWCERLIESVKLPQYPAIKSCMEMVEAASCMVDSADSVVVCDAYGEFRYRMSCSFLSKTEHNALSQSIRLWNTEAEREYHKSLLLKPLLMAREKLVLVVCKKSGNEDIHQHPLITWLKGRLGDDYTKIIEFKHLEEQYYKQTDVIDNTCDEAYINFTNTHLLKLREHESPTSIEDLFESPLDYMLNNIAHLTPSSESEMRILAVTKGIVAHQVIATIFSPEKDGRAISADEIGSRIDGSFDEVFDLALQECGSQLLRPEFYIDKKRLRKEILECIESLIDVLSANSLKVKACEYKVDDTEIGIIGVSSQSVAVNGRIDMVLCDDEGSPIIFDLKYTSYPQNFYEKLSTGTAYQLALYAELLKMQLECGTIRTGYYIMPRGVLYTCDDFTGKHIYHIKKTTGINTLEIVMEEYRRTMEELAKGAIAYRDVDGKCLMASFSSFKLFYD